MPFIGIFAKENDNNFIKNEINKYSISNKYDVININLKSLENLKNVKFDVLIIKENIIELLKRSNNIEKIINNSNYIIINTDINKDCIAEEKDNIITYGFNTNSDISISSIKDENILLCVKRKIKGIKEQIIEEQEVAINVRKHNINKLYNIMAIFTVLCLYGERLKNN